MESVWEMLRRRRPLEAAEAAWGGQLQSLQVSESAVFQESQPPSPAHDHSTAGGTSAARNPSAAGAAATHPATAGVAAVSLAVDAPPADVAADAPPADVAARSLPADAPTPAPSGIWGALSDFHPAVRAWFERRFPAGPTPAQSGAWPALASGRHVLVSAPTGSGKTLAAFLRAIDELWKMHDRAVESGGDGLADETLVVYVSPLKALAADIRENLTGPLGEIAEIGRSLGYEPPDLRVGVRSGDTAAGERAAMLRRPPHLVITTPESLYLLLTAGRSRETLRSARWVIVDEIHAMARDKRGSHLALSLERLAHVCRERPRRIGLSATQRPIETLRRLLVGVAGEGRWHDSGDVDVGDAGDGADDMEGDGAGTADDDSVSNGAGADDGCVVVDVGHRRKLDLALELPPSELEAVAPAEQLSEMLDRITELVAERRSTLIFVNTRRESERIAHLLAERLGQGEVAAHHGSLSKERRQRVEGLLRAGALRALVATASLELGIDIGPVDLVCQIGSPRSLNVFLQRVGRSGHSVGATPTGRIFPTTRDQLVECAALLAGVRAGRLDSVRPPKAPLDILAQQLVAECAAERWGVDDLFDLVRRAAPYAELSRGEFEETLAFVNSGVNTGSGRRGAYVHLDAESGEAAGRRGARLAALTSGGAIGDVADYRVVLEPDDTFIGTVNEDWAIESMAGDIFLLGSHSWQIRRIGQGVVRVADAAGAPPTVPFWLGEAPARTPELSREVSELREMVLDWLDGATDATDATGSLGDSGSGQAATGGEAAQRGMAATGGEAAQRGMAATGSEAAQAACSAVAERCGMSAEAAEAVVGYLAAGRAALGTLPTQRRLVVERFFDDTGGMQLVVHSPWGGRLNRGLGLALRKRFCRTFDFELQAAANDDAVVLSLGPQHSFPLESVMRMLNPATVADTLTQAILPTPMFAVRWRWNLNRALVVLRFKRGRRNPPQIQRMEADDVMAAVFPGLAACGENLAGPIPIPDHMLVRQTVADALQEATDVHGLRSLLVAVRSGEVAVVVRDSPEASPLCHEILNGRPFTFLDDAPLEERRTRAARTPRGLPVDLSEIGSLRPEAIDRVRSEAAADVRDADELHDLLSTLVLCRPDERWDGLFLLLEQGDRASCVGGFWCNSANEAGVRRMLGAAAAATASGAPACGAASGALPEDDEDRRLAREAVRGHLEISGPATLSLICEATSLSEQQVRGALAELEAEGFALSGRFEAAEEQQWCSRRLLARIHVYSLKRRRAEIQAVSAQDFMRFLLRWQHVAPGTQVRGRAGLLAILEQLQGFETAAGAWEKQVLGIRVGIYQPLWLDELCLSGEVVWGRLSLRADDDARRAAAASRATPVTLGLRSDFGWLASAARGHASPSLPGAGAAAEIIESLQRHGARFASELADDCRRLPSDIDAGLTEGVARGLLSADGFGALRSLFGPRGGNGAARRHHAARRKGGLRRGGAAPSGAVGRWSLLPHQGEDFEPDALAEATAEQLLARWGVVFRDLMRVECVSLPWREILRALRRLEARGQIRGGRFVTGFAGEQYALPAAVDELRRVRGLPREGERVQISAADPLNLTGVITPGPRLASSGVGRITFVDGNPDPGPTAEFAGKRPAAAATAGAPGGGR